MLIKRTILIADDNDRILETLSRNLVLEGFEVLTARNGQEAIQRHKTECPDIVLVDVRMPGISGFEVLAELRALDEEVEVILVTGHGDVEMTIDALRAGASDFIPKPVDQETLMAALSRAIRRIELKEELHSAQAARARYAADLEARNQELRQTQARLVREENLALLGSLAFALMHEINNPLSTIKMAAAFTKQLPEATPVISKNMDTIDEEANRISAVIRRIHSIPKPTPETMNPLDINKLLKAALQTAHDQDLLDHCDVVLDLAPDLPAVEGQAEQLEQIFLNIILNAGEAMLSNVPDQPRTLSIGTDQAFESEIGVQCVRVRIADTGPGIPEDALKRVFNPDYTTKTRNGEMQGLGLGLLVARGIIEIHGGQMALNNRSQGSGVIVTIRLPGEVEADAEA